MYGVTPCPQCGSKYRWPTQRGAIQCDDCGLVEAQPKADPSQETSQMKEPQTMVEHMVLNLTDDELGTIEKTLALLKTGDGGHSPTVQSIELRYPPHSQEIHAVVPATRGADEVKWAEFYFKGANGSNLARTLELAVRYLDLLPVAVALLREARHELGCVEQSLDAMGVPKALPTGELYSLHGRVLTFQRPPDPSQETGK